MAIKVFRVVLLSVFVILIFLFGGFFYNSNLHHEESNLQQEEWNKGNEVVEKPKVEDIDQLYEMIRVPKLDQLLVNTTFIKQVNVKRYPYFLGYSDSGQYAAFIEYDDFKSIGYYLKVYNTKTGEKVYGAFIPDVKGVFDTDEFIQAQQALEDGFHITVPPKKVNWVNSMVYVWDKQEWNFKLSPSSTALLIRKENTNLKWTIPFMFENREKENWLQIFYFPGKKNWLTIVPVHLNEHPEPQIKNLQPRFVYLDNLNYKNSLDGIQVEADNWLYGHFTFVYNQGNASDNKGAIAISADELEDSPVLNKDFHSQVQQWVYIDPSGKMNWYGNSQGIFNGDGKPLQKLDRSFNYRISLKYDSKNKSLQYFIIDQFDQFTKDLVRTIEFKWNKGNFRMEPIQAIHLM